MNETINRSNLKVLGTSSSLGGYFLEVKVTGECKFAGDVDCQSLSLTGETKVSGGLRMEKLKMTGQLSVQDRIEGGSLRGQGEVQTSGLSVEQLKFSGSMEVRGDCEAEDLQMGGALKVKGLLSAENLQLTLYGPGSAAEVGGGTITIKRSKTKTLFQMGHGRDMIFTTGLIEGDFVELQNTHAATVRGEKVIIGPGCVIQNVEYSDYLEIHKNAIVKQQTKFAK